MNWTDTRRRPARLLLALGLLVPATACSRAETLRESGARESRPTGDVPYTLTDTVLWESPGIGGYRAVLRRGTEIIDTVALHFGVHAVGRDSIVFLPIRTDPTDTITGPWQYLLGHVLYHRGARRALAPILPNFDPCFSQPSVIDSMLYYWGLRKTDGSIVRYAARFDFRRAHVDSIQLDSVEMATDNCYYLPEPIAADEGVVFEPYLVSRDFSSTRIVEP